MPSGVSPYMTVSRARQFCNLLRSKIAEGIVVRIYTLALREQQGYMHEQAKIIIEEFRHIGVRVVERSGLHEKFAFIDRKVTWEGSLNILSNSQDRTTEHMRRSPSSKICEELIRLHRFDGNY